jgi:hypothetical protein
MSNLNEDGAVERPVIFRDETADVEGHIRKEHTVRVQQPVDGPRPAHSEDGEDDGPDVEGHALRF